MIASLVAHRPDRDEDAFTEPELDELRNNLAA